MVGGKPDAKKAHEIDFWETAAREGLTDEAVRASAARFKPALSELDRRLERASYLFGPSLSLRVPDAGPCTRVIPAARAGVGKPEEKEPADWCPARLQRSLR